MAFSDLFKVYPNRNPELRAVAKKAYEFGRNIAQEPSANLTMGILDAAVERQVEYIARTKEMVTALASRPIPDKPAVHPTNYPIDLSKPYPQFRSDIHEKDIPLNEETELIATAWMELAVGLAMSNSASIPGSMIEHDKGRALKNLDVISKYMDEFKKRPILDIPETAEPGAELRTGDENE